jgi:hypothetical protein
VEDYNFGPNRDGTQHLHPDDLRRVTTFITECELERSGFEAGWDDIGRHISPHRYRRCTTDANEDVQNWKSILNMTAVLASRTFSAGMTGGLTNPSRTWFKTMPRDPKLRENSKVKRWHAEVDEQLRMIMLGSNLYTTLPMIYQTIGDYGTAALLIDEDEKDVIRCHSFPIKSFAFSVDHRGHTSGWVHRFMRTPAQLIKEFGENNVSDSVREQFNNGSTEGQFEIVHVIMRNDMWDGSKLGSAGKKWLSIYIEWGGSSKTSGITANAGQYHETNVLSVKGYSDMPVMCPRMWVNGEDTWGTGNGHVAIGHIKEIMELRRKKSVATDKQLDPPMVAPSSMRNKRASTLSNDVTYVSGPQGVDGFKPAYQVNFDIPAARAEIMELEQEIRRVYNEDLFLMLTNSDRREITATEVMERKEEKMLALGPVMNRLNDEMLDPMVERIFMIAHKRGMLPEPPEELEGQELTIEYVSVMAQAMKANEIGALERMAGYTMQVAQADPNVLHKYKFEKSIESMADAIGVDPSLIADDEEYQAIMTRIAQQEAQARQVEMNQAAASTAKDLAEAQLTNIQG